MISVVVLAHGAGNHLAESLESLSRQTFSDFEAVVVGDAAGTGIELPDSRFRVVKGDGLSRGAAFELGIAETGGEFLAFVEGCDRVPPQALELLHDALAGSRSDFAAGNVSVITESGGTWRAYTHKEAFAKRLRHAHIKKHSSLLHDRYVTGKLFRRSFWDAAGLGFPDGSRYEDLAVAIPAHFLASAVEILPEMTVYRRRELYPQPTTDGRDIADGFAAVDRIERVLEGHWRASARRRFQLTVLGREFKVFLNALPDCEPAERELLVDLAARYTEGVDPRLFQRLSALGRLKWHLASRRLTTELVKVIRYERGKSSPSIVRSPIRRYVVYPYWKDDKLAIPESVYRARDELRLRSRATSVEWRDGKLVITGEAYINSVGMRRRWTSVKGVVLRQGNRRILVPARKKLVKKAWRGMEFTINPRQLRGPRGWKDGVWELDAAVFNAGVFRRGKIQAGTSGSGAQPPYAYVEDDVRIVPEVVEKTLRVRVETVQVRVTGLRWDGDALEVIGRARSGAPERLTVVRMDREVSVPVAVTAGGFTARLPLGDLPDVRADESRLDDTVVWRAFLDGLPMVLVDEVEPIRRLLGEREVIAGRNPSGYLRLSLRTARFTVRSLELAGDGSLAVEGVHPVHGGGGTLVLSSRNRKQEHRFPLTDGRARLPLARMHTLAGMLPLRQGRWELLYRAQGRPLALQIAETVRLPEPVEVERRTYSLENQNGRLVVAASSDLRPEEISAGAKLRQEARLKVKEAGLRDAVLFSCFNGRQYSDSPRAIHEELVRRGSTLEQLWVVGDGQVELPSTVRPVRLNGVEWHEAVASSRYIVTNHRLGDWFHRHPDQIVLQTWHGTPLKKIGRDVKEVHFAYSPGMQKAMATEEKEPRLPEWTHLVSPNPFSTPILQRAFKFEGELIEAGYPRNDLLHSPDARRVAERVRSLLGVPAGKKVVLYAPTWRDDQFYGVGRYKSDWRIDLDMFERELADDHVLVARLHPNVVDGAPERPFVYDASSYPDIGELYLAADLLVTDYSSVMFDFAELRRPMLFYTYDLAHYRDKLRGFYFDFEREAPGPLLETSEELIEAIGNVGEVSRKYAAAYDAFYERFCSLDDGFAAARVVDRVFGA
ncbi:bifunctional glycosyltransferase/CDP-glycerol:glycerophosphate glycerophosphotransferase [Actinocorallia populi]|uniref:bifunctional glycosyltransferase/CDP-glycerol:glycerophosphate glycerophosphotransferase n=1 Tax=Actinocorallia populi TaxID=2079200 RepID=UPI000D08E771|nr:bifunctional glycosyltransferase family 2 protein/CDP-glycerol:glycerophosphate glycerophosphotransferase [Actinocorallia populi]